MNIINVEMFLEPQTWFWKHIIGVCIPAWVAIWYGESARRGNVFDINQTAGDIIIIRSVFQLMVRFIRRPRYNRLRH